MNMNKVTPLWFVQGDELRLSIHYWKPNETTDGHSGCSMNWTKRMDDGDFKAAYNSIVDSATKEFHIPYMKKIKFPKSAAISIEEEIDNKTMQLVMFIIVFCIGAFVGKMFL
jgi:hypothetical protein